MNRRTVEESSAATAALQEAGISQTRSESQKFQHANRWILLAAVAFYVCMAFRMASVKSPWVDEGWIASAPANWARTGSMGTPSLSPTGSWLSSELTGINQYTYWNMPVPIFAQALWFKLLGFTLLTMRSLGILFGLLALGSWYVIVSKLSGSRLAGSLAAALLAVDYTFLWYAADGRMDMMCAALGSTGVACYLTFRETHWTRALWLANTFLALALFTHPNAVLPLLTFLFLLLFFDRTRLSWRDLASLTPYMLLATMWGVYILQRPDLFLAQFAANTAVRGGSRWVGLANPWAALQSEIVVRYLFHYGTQPMWDGPLPQYTFAIPLLYWLGLAAAWIYAPLRRCRGMVAMLSITVLQLIYMTLFEGMKFPHYLVYILPLYASVLAVLVWKLHARNSVLAPASLLVVILLAGCQISVEKYEIRANPYRHEFLPTVEFVRARAARGATVVADSYLGIELGFDQLRDDARLGFYSGIRPDLVVRDSWYDLWWNDIFSAEEPELHRYVTHLLETEYAVVFEKGQFRVYERRGE